MSYKQDLPEAVSVAIIGCGKLGTALIRGFLCHGEPLRNVTQLPHLPAVVAPLEISHIFATVRQQSSQERVQNSIKIEQASILDSGHRVMQVTVQLQSQNCQAINDADIVILGCKPSAYKEVLGKKGIRKGLLEGIKRKIFISILGGVTTHDLENAIFQVSHQASLSNQYPSILSNYRDRCLVIRAIPNIAARIRESMTVLALPASFDNNEDGKHRRSIVDLLFQRVGLTKWVAESQMNHASALCASALAFYTNLIAAAAEGALGNGDGLSQADALQISAQAARGASGLILSGEDTKHITDEVATKGGSTMAGLKILEQRDSIAAIRDAIEETAIATKALASSLR